MWLQWFYQQHVDVDSRVCMATTFCSWSKCVSSWAEAERGHEINKRAGVCVIRIHQSHVVRYNLHWHWPPTALKRLNKAECWDKPTLKCTIEHCTFAQYWTWLFISMHLIILMNATWIVHLCPCYWYANSLLRILSGTHYRSSLWEILSQTARKKNTPQCPAPS